MIHPKDKQNLADVRFAVQKVISESIQDGCRGADMAAINGHHPGFMRIPWDQDRRTEDWHWSTLHGLADGAGSIAMVHFGNLPEVESPMYEMGLINRVYLGIGVLDRLKKTREHLGISHTGMGRRLGTVKSSVHKLESADDPRLLSLMRLARALGGYLRYEVGT